MVDSLFIALAVLTVALVTVTITQRRLRRLMPHDDHEHTEQKP